MSVHFNFLVASTSGRLLARLANASAYTYNHLTSSLGARDMSNQNSIGYPIPAKRLQVINLFLYP
jgi:hypothetical protein